VDHAIANRRIAGADDLFGNDAEGRDDELGFAAGLRLALPLGLGIWAILIWSVVRFLF